MAKETNLFREMGYSTEMGKDMRGSISGVCSSKAPATDVDRDAKTMTSYGVLGRGDSKGKRGGHKRHPHKRRK
jgi:hypothetical protein